MEQYEGVTIEIKFPCCLCNELIKNPNFLVFQLSWENFQNSIFLIKVKLLILYERLLIKILSIDMNFEIEHKQQML